MIIAQARFNVFPNKDESHSTFGWSSNGVGGELLACFYLLFSDFPPQLQARHSCLSECTWATALEELTQ
jgi:hypothetical protein